MPESCDMLISAGMILCHAADGGFRVLEDAALAVTDGLVSALGDAKQPGRIKAREHLRLPRCLVMPGLINAHTHVSMTLFRGLADDLPLMDWLQTHIFPRERHLNPEMVEIGALIGCAEMLRSGTTAFMDMYLIEDAVAKAVRYSGMRARLGEAIFAFPTPICKSLDETEALIRDQAARYKDDAHIRVAVMPHTVYTTTPQILLRCRDLAEELDLPLHIHLNETQTEVQQCLASHGKRPPALLHELGLLGPRCSIAHGVMLDKDELDLLAATCTRVVHCPRSNMKLASGVAPLPAMLARGMLPGLGTDGASSSNNLNMFAEMSVCALLHKVAGQDPTLTPAHSVLDMATRGGAQALHWPELGRLEIGAPADLIALDLDQANLLPLYRPESHLVYAAGGHEVRLSMVAGRVLFKDGGFTNLDYPALLQEAAKARKWVLSL
ncbi:amidohydrolase [Desulfovibrio sp. OttesenSCG-928-A18]|nr:amidohydrolase [Desulfovibrio sp. OttesenSCG-928-A18]